MSQYEIRQNHGYGRSTDVIYQADSLEDLAEWASEKVGDGGESDE